MGRYALIRLPLLLVALLLMTFASSAQAGLLVLSYHDIRDDVAAKGDPDRYAVSTSNFAAHLDWLRSHAYHPVSVQQVLDARAGKRALPSRPVLLTFDDGLRSVYTRVFPLLQAYGYPALVAPVTSWVELPVGQVVPYGHRDFTHDDFVTWAQLREMQDSGLIEIGSHSDDLHKGIAGNPFGNQTPAAVTRHWDAGKGYESEADYRQRIQTDLRHSRDAIVAHLGKPPRAMVWPYAAYNRASNEIAAQLGMTLSFDLEGRSHEADIGQQGRDRVDGQSLGSLGRLLLFNNPDVRDLAGELRRDLSRDGLRAIQIDLDYVYDPDPAQLARNLDILVQRVKDIGPAMCSCRPSPTRTATAQPMRCTSPTGICRCARICSGAWPGSCAPVQACACSPGCRCWAFICPMPSSRPHCRFTARIRRMCRAWIRAIRARTSWLRIFTKTLQQTRISKACCSMTMLTCATTKYLPMAMATLPSARSS